MKTVRLGVFETNSSSCHSVALISKKSFEDWRDKKKIYFTKRDMHPDEYGDSGCDEVSVALYHDDEFITVKEFMNMVDINKLKEEDMNSKFSASIFKILKENWNEDFLKKVLCGEYEPETEDEPDAVDFQDFICNKFNIYVESFNNVFSHDKYREDSPYYDEYTAKIKIGGEDAYLFTAYESC